MIHRVLLVHRLKKGRALTRFCAADYLYAALLPVYPEFATAMRTLLAGFGAVGVALLKSMARTEAKYDADYAAAAFPAVMHVKDILRCAVSCSGHEEMLRARAAIGARYEVVSCKDRREAATHDVVVVIRFQGFLAEIQLHFTATRDLKAFAHAAFDLTRIDCPDGTLLALETLYDGAWMCHLDLARVGRDHPLTECTLRL